MSAVQQNKESKEGLLGIDCKKLHYTFAGGDEAVLEDIDLQLEQGSRCLLVGANGGESGFSTAPGSWYSVWSSVAEVLRTLLIPSR